jgi:hypothetical protein
MIKKEALFRKFSNKQTREVLTTSTGEGDGRFPAIQIIHIYLILYHLPNITEAFQQPDHLYFPKATNPQI